MTRPVSHRMKKLTRHVSHQHERARETKEVSGQQENENECAAKVDPR